MTTNLFHSVVILDAIPDGDLGTARRLRGDLRDIAMTFSPTPEIQYYRIKSPADFVAVIRQLTRGVEVGGDFHFFISRDMVANWGLRWPTVQLSLGMK